MENIFLKLSASFNSKFKILITTKNELFRDLGKQHLTVQQMAQR